MKLVLVFIIILFTAGSYAQLNKQVSIATTGNVNAIIKGLEANSTGFGMNLSVGFFSRHKVNLIAETEIDGFYGDKVLYIDPTTGKQGSTQVIYIAAGGRYFILPNISFSASLGPSWYQVNDTHYSNRLNTNYHLTGYYGRNKKVITELVFHHIYRASNNIQYLSFGVGYRF